ncbi:MAG: MaoC family dehydratase [Truepera sp.]|nr:MaoC family dehydratase [Truepera sp.]
MKTFTSIAALKAAIGQTLGPSDWLLIDQERVQAFALTTDDPQWIHLDSERARRESPYRQTVAHGYLTLSLIPGLLRQIFALEGAKLRINYGLNRVRFPAPVLVPSRVRLQAVINEVTEFAGGVQVVFDVRFDNDRQEKPVCVAQIISRLVVGEE